MCDLATTLSGWEFEMRLYRDFVILKMVSFTPATLSEGEGEMRLYHD